MRRLGLVAVATAVVLVAQAHSTMSCRCAGLCRGKGYGDGVGCCLLRYAEGLCVGGLCAHACCAAMRSWDADLRRTMATVAWRATWAAACEGRYFRVYFAFGGGMDFETYGNDISDWNWGPPELCEVLEQEDRVRCGARQERWRPM